MTLNIKQVITKIKNWIMAKYATLKAAIDEIITTNGNYEISGEDVRNTLKAIVDSLGADYQLVGFALPETDPGTPDQNVAYLAGPGTYPNFGPTTVEKGQIGMFKYNGTWSYETIDCGVSIEYEEYPGGDAFEWTFYDSDNPDGLTIKIAKTVSGLGNDPDVAISQWWAAQTERKINVLGGYTISIDSLTITPQSLGLFKIIQSGQIIDSITGTNKLIFGTDGGGSVTVNASDLPYKATANLINVRTESGTANNVSIVVRGINDILPAYININEIANHPGAYASAAAALSDVPALYRRKGVKVVYFDDDTQLQIEMLCYDNAGGSDWWTDVTNNWVIEGPIETKVATPTGGQQLRIAGEKRGNLDDVLNVNVWNEQIYEYDSAALARAAVPANKRKLGAIITYLVSTGTDTSGWMIDEFIGSSISDWGVADNWKTIGPVSVSQNTETGGKTIKIGNNDYPVTDTNEIVLCNTMLDGDGAKYNEPHSEFAHAPFLEATTGIYKSFNLPGPFFVSPFIPCNAFEIVHFHGLERADTALCVQYDKDYNIIPGTVINGTLNETDKDITIDSNAYFIRFCATTTVGYIVSVKYSTVKEAYRQQFEKIVYTIGQIISGETNLENKYVLNNIMLDGDGNEYIKPVISFAHSPFLQKDTGIYRNYNILASFYVTPFIPCYGIDSLHFHGKESEQTALCVQYDKNQNIIPGTVVNGTYNEKDKDITIDANAFYIRFCGDTGFGVQITVNGSTYKEATRKVLQYLIGYNPTDIVKRIGMDNTVQQGVTANPLQTILANAGLSAIFHEWGFIGDSLSSGANYDKYGYESSNIYAIYSYSWCQRLIAMIGGARGSNWSVAGFTAKSWITKYWDNEAKAEYTTDGVDSYFKTDKKQTYCIMLGTNDAGTGVTLGNFDTDVDLQDFNNNANTFIGNYAGIIQRIKSLTPSAKIFVITCPLSTAAESNGYNAAIKDMANRFNNVFVIDVKTYMPTNADFVTAYVKDGHYTTQGYQYFAFAIATYIDYIVRTNPAAFKYVEIINTSFDDGTY